jgi:hypothetical protein
LAVNFETFLFGSTTVILLYLFQRVEILGMVRIERIKTFLSGGYDIAGKVVERFSCQIGYCRTILALAK